MIKFYNNCYQYIKDKYDLYLYGMVVFYVAFFTWFMSLIAFVFIKCLIIPTLYDCINFIFNI